jgi:GAF domain-containing protein
MDDRHREALADRARQRSHRELDLAGDAAEAATRAELCYRTRSPLGRRTAARLAAVHRSSQERHLATARLHAAHADRLLAQQTGSAAAFIAAVADVSRGNAVVLSLSGHEQPEALVAASGPVADASHELETTWDEGPAREAAVRRRFVRVLHQLPAVWPLYGSAVSGYGVRAVCAAPLSLEGRCLGTITTLNPHPDGGGSGLRADQLADALLYALLDSGISDDDPGLPGIPALEDADDQALMHQAAGMVAVESGVEIPAALALIRARAFADGQPAASIAAEVVSRRLRLTLGD